MTRARCPRSAGDRPRRNSLRAAIHRYAVGGTLAEHTEMAECACLDVPLADSRVAPNRADCERGECEEHDEQVGWEEIDK
jgi:hypothetical protein